MNTTVAGANGLRPHIGPHIGKALLALLITDLAYAAFVTLPALLFLSLRSTETLGDALAAVQGRSLSFVWTLLLYPALSLLIILAGTVTHLLAGNRLRMRPLACLLLAVCTSLATLQTLAFLVIFSMGPTSRLGAIVTAAQVIPFSLLWVCTYLRLLRPRKTGVSRTTGPMLSRQTGSKS